METLAVVAYIGPVSRPEIARLRGVAADSAVASLVERGLVAEAGRDSEGGAVRYETTPLFERVFGLAGLNELPELDDLGGDAEELRARLEAVAERALDPADDRFGLVAGEAAERLGRDAAVPHDREEDLGGGLVVGRLEDLDQVVAAEGHERVDELAAALLDRALGLLDAVAPGGHAADAAGRPLHQRDVDGHGRGL